MSRRGLCLVLASPSGGGKTTMMSRLLATDPGLRQSVSATTRSPRPGELDGVDYYFCDQREFDLLVTSDSMLEHATVFGRSYGIPRAPVEAALDAGTDVVFVIDWQGHRRLRDQLPGDVVGVFLVPPSMAELRARLERRGDAAADIESRMADAGSEMSHRSEFDHQVENDDLDCAVEEVRALLEDARALRQAVTADRRPPAAPST